MKFKTEPNDFIELKHISSGSDYTGLTKREYFAGLALQGILSSLIGEHAIELTAAENIAKESVMMADCLINALNKEQGNENKYTN